ncbi:MAG: geranylgeranyl reductase family protein [Dehalococcoidales bacterium]|nr:geranylgeranyl reductase family protein [Dehalococcoidales bacterium]
MPTSRYSQYDVTVVGAGPAGTFLSYLLSTKGLKVLLVEKARLPRNKVCAGGITVRAGSLLPFDFSECVENTIYGVRFSFNCVPERVRTYHLPLAYMVLREKFDAFLVERAREAGVSVEDNMEVRGVKEEKDQVRIDTISGSFTTPLVAGADGANSVIARSMKLRNSFKYGLGFSSQVKAAAECFKQWDGLIGLDWGIRGGYAWVFPKKDQINTGAGGSIRKARNLELYTRKLIEAYQLGRPDRLKIQGHLMPMRMKSTPLNFQRILLLGDAAGLIDPLTGEGIYYALKSAYLASTAILDYKSGKADLKAYRISVEREIVPELKIARSIQKINSLTPRFFYHYLKDSDRFWRAFCRILRGERDYITLNKSLNPPLRLLFNLI